VTYPSGQWIDVSPSIDQSAALRHSSNQLMAWSPQNPHELIAAFQCLMSTTDGGMHWRKISPDLTIPKAQQIAKPAPKPATPATPPADAPRRGGFSAIDSFSSSTVAPGVIWAGTTNGLVWVSKDHGRSWDEVTIPNLPGTRSDIWTIDASHHDAATAYVAVDAHNSGDFGPYVYRTHDYGHTWTKIVNGLATDEAGGSFARVIRADTKRAGLLFAGTESSMYVSFDDGDHWQSLMLSGHRHP
jgi:photosystem II stability/assembly factor-like uncharacterized protein